MLLRIKHNSYLKYRVSVWNEKKKDKMQNSFAGESHPDFLLGVRISLSSKSVTQRDKTSGISIFLLFQGNLCH